LTWERLPVDPLPGPRRIDELHRARRLNEVTALAGADTTGPGGFHFAESHVARHLGEPTLLLDPNQGPAAIAEGLAGTARELRCDLVVLVDVGGDVLGHGDEACLAAAPALVEAGVPALLAVFGAGCDGELTPDEVHERVTEVARAGGDLGRWGPGHDELVRLDAAVAEVPTEASAMALRCARGETGRATIRDGRRTVLLTPLGGLLIGLDPLVALRSAARCAALVGDAGSLQEANAILRDHGIRTELDYEAAQPPPSPPDER
jgi:hypothetical protein